MGQQQPRQSQQAKQMRQGQSKQHNWQEHMQQRQQQQQRHRASSAEGRRSNVSLLSPQQQQAAQQPGKGNQSRSASSGHGINTGVDIRDYLRSDHGSSHSAQIAAAPPKPLVKQHSHKSKHHHYSVTDDGQGLTSQSTRRADGTPPSVIMKRSSLQDVARQARSGSGYRHKQPADTSSSAPRIHALSRCALIEVVGVLCLLPNCLVLPR